MDQFSVGELVPGRALLRGWHLAREWWPFKSLWRQALSQYLPPPALFGPFHGDLEPVFLEGAHRVRPDVGEALWEPHTGKGRTAWYQVSFWLLRKTWYQVMKLKVFSDWDILIAEATKPCLSVLRQVPPALWACFLGCQIVKITVPTHSFVFKGMPLKHLALVFNKCCLLVIIRILRKCKCKLKTTWKISPWGIAL